MQSKWLKPQTALNSPQLTGWGFYLGLLSTGIPLWKVLASRVDWYGCPLPNKEGLYEQESI